MTDFPALTGLPVFFRTYSRQKKEEWANVCDRTTDGLRELGDLEVEECALLYSQMRALRSLPSGRWLWVGGADWIKEPKNYSGAYNCTSTVVKDWRSLGLMMALAMMGSGTGAVLEEVNIALLPVICNRLDVKITALPGEGAWGHSGESEHFRDTQISFKADGKAVQIVVGDSREGWVDAYETLFHLASNHRPVSEVEVQIDLSRVRPKGAKLKGFGGVANPGKLPDLFPKVARILNNAIGRKLHAGEVCLCIDEAAVTIVAGNIRRSAGMRQFDWNALMLKQNLWQQKEDGSWEIDPDRDALRMANHTHIYHRKPTEKECLSAVRSQYYSGEGAVQWAGEAVARANVDLLFKPVRRREFLAAYNRSRSEARSLMSGYYFLEYREAIDLEELEHRMARYGLNPCGK